MTGWTAATSATSTVARCTICEQCDNYATAPEFIPQLQAQLADITALRDDAAGRGWHTEVARHSRVIASLGCAVSREPGDPARGPGRHSAQRKDEEWQ